MDFWNCIVQAVGVALAAAVMFVIGGVIVAFLAGAFGAGGVGAVPAVAVAIIPLLKVAGLFFLVGSALLIAACIVSYLINSAAGDTGTADSAEEPCIICTALRAGLFTGAMGAVAFMAERALT